ncbi:MAG TPA: UDP-galactose-lipid carrier transferase [Verrucomicrobiae bacterium]|nr:UDP-galactose-lipid carrier transferase [Verrucomicrobiae bacterium]
MPTSGDLIMVKSGAARLRLDDLSLKGDKRLKEIYDELLLELHTRAVRLQAKLAEAKRSAVIVIEGPDAAGKGGAIRRFVERLDARRIHIYSVGKPTHDEISRHYMWRFWRRMPARGEIVIFDRSWYGRVLVERVEGLATETEWRRAFDEINRFEQMLIDDGTIVIKFYLHIGKDEQLDRFRARQADPLKQWKITDEDWRNREKWEAHNEAAEEMFALTASDQAPWCIIASNDKKCSRIAFVQEVVRRLDEELG